MSFCTASASRRKGPPAIWQHSSPVLDYVRSAHPQVSTVHFTSDGPCSQYKQRGNLFVVSTELFRRGFTAGTWSLTEASHGKGALKRRADCLVPRGRDIPDAAELFAVLQETQQSSCFLSAKHQLRTQRCLMMCHQFCPLWGLIRYCPEPVENSYTGTSAACAQQHKIWTVGALMQSISISTSSRLPPCLPQWQRFSPGVITDTSETHVEVRCVQKIGINRFFWPAHEDILWYLFEDIVCIIPPLKPVTGRHMEMNRETWAKLQKSY